MHNFNLELNQKHIYSDKNILNTLAMNLNRLSTGKKRRKESLQKYILKSVTSKLIT